MLEVQKYLKDVYGHGHRHDVIQALDALKEELGIKYKVHSTRPLVILNYDSIKSPKSHPIVLECRGLVLELDTWEVVAKSFGRFFNYGEMLEITDKFVWNREFEAWTKEDGSYINFFWYDDEWIMSTRGSWGEDECGFSGKTFKELVWSCIPNDLVVQGNKTCNYIFEFTSIHNKIVRMYPEMGLVLLGIVWNYPNASGVWEVPSGMVDMAAEKLGLKRPEYFRFDSYEEVYEYLIEKAKQDPTFEGVVLKDENGLRIKVKSATYCALHHLKGEGDNMYNPKYIVPLVMAGEMDELLAYFPEVEERLLDIKKKIDDAYDELWHVWYNSQEYEGQRSFAEYIMGKTKFASILFKLRKEYGQYQPTDWHLKDVWTESTQLILKVLFNK